MVSIIYIIIILLLLSTEISLNFALLYWTAESTMIPTVKIGMLPCISNFPRVYAETTNYSYIPSFDKNNIQIFTFLILIDVYRVG